MENAHSADNETNTCMTLMGSIKLTVESLKLEYI